jgi:alkylhydroperoxidase family enzyme
LSSRERLVADFTVKVTRTPNACSPLDIDELRKAGLSDKDIVCLVEIVSYQNMSTRIMESLSTVD